MQAIRALNEVDVFFVVEKGEEKRDLIDLRREICERYIERPAYRTVELRDPERDRGARRPTARRSRPGAASARSSTRRRSRASWPPGECGAFLVWGDPALYDSTLAIVEEILAGDPERSRTRWCPGSPACRRWPRGTASRSIASAGRSTSRRAGGSSEGLHDEAGDVVVMLDAGCAFRRFADEPMEIYWGAYVGTPDEILIAGAVAEVVDEIERVRAEARERKGWIMDTYLLRRRP